MPHPSSVGAQVTVSGLFKMAGGNDLAVSVSCARILEAASPSLQNCVKFSNNGKYFSVLCDFGIVSVCELKGKNF